MLNREAILSGQNTFYEQLRLSLQDLYTVALFAVSKRRRKFFQFECDFLGMYNKLGLLLTICSAVSKHVTGDIYISAYIIVL